MNSRSGAPDTLTCPDCGAARPRLVGRGISFGRYAGGRLVDSAQRPGIYRCGTCSLVFKHPRIGGEEALDFYNEADGSVWSSRLRPEFDQAQQLVEACGLPSPRVLDVGCNRGEFLSRLGPDVGKFGVEVNRSAAAHARADGMQVWAQLSDIPDDQTFDVVTTFDVIEHVETPGPFLHALLARVAPGGLLLVSSGDADAFLAQPRPALNWYFANPEHVSFVSEAWFRGRLKGAPPATLEDVRRFLHGRAIQGAVPRFKIAAFKAWPAGYLGLYKLAKKTVSSEGGLFVPGNGYSVDHLCAVIRRN